jgi:hypothetical protein
VFLIFFFLKVLSSIFLIFTKLIIQKIIQKINIIGIEKVLIIIVSFSHCVGSGWGAAYRSCTCTSCIHPSNHLTFSGNEINAIQKATRLAFIL